MVAIFWAEQFSVVGCPASPGCSYRGSLDIRVELIPQLWQAKMSPGTAKGPLWMVAKFWPVTENQTSFILHYLLPNGKLPLYAFLCVHLHVWDTYKACCLASSLPPGREGSDFILSTAHCNSQSSIGCLQAQPQDCVQNFSEVWPMVKFSR